jgi:hypothetical protein
MNTAHGLTGDLNHSMVAGAAVGGVSCWWMPAYPKHPSTRRRRNKAAGFRTLVVDDEPDLSVPPLPDRPEGWRPETVQRWEIVMNSPMRSEWTDSDVRAMVDLAKLWDRLYGETDTIRYLKLMAEIRMQDQRYGLSPMDRRRLQWEIQRGEAAEYRTDAIRRSRERAPIEVDVVGEDKPQPAIEPAAVDPRDLLAG